MKSRVRTLLQSAALYLTIAGVIAGLGFFVVELLDQTEELREISPDAGMTKHCTRNSDGTLACSQVPIAPKAPAAPPDPDAPMFVTVGP